MPDKENSEYLGFLEASRKSQEGINTAPLLQESIVNLSPKASLLKFPLPKFLLVRFLLLKVKLARLLLEKLSKSKLLLPRFPLAEKFLLKVQLVKTPSIKDLLLESSSSNSLPLKHLSLEALSAKALSMKTKSSLSLSSFATLDALKRNLSKKKSFNLANLLKTNCILRQKLSAKDDNAKNICIKSPLTFFSTTNHTLKQIIPQNQHKNNAECNEIHGSKDSVVSEDSNTTYANKPRVRQLGGQNDDYDEKDKIKKWGKKRKKPKRNPLLRLTLFFTILCCVMIAGYKILSNGIFIERMQFGNATVSNIFLQLKNKLVLNIDDIDLSSLGNGLENEVKPFNEILQEATLYAQRTLYVLSYFELLHIKKLKLPGNQQWSVEYTGANYNINGTLFDLEFAIENNHSTIHFAINKFRLKTLPLHFGGTLTYSIPNKQLLFDMRVINNDNTKENLALKGTTNFQNITLNANSSKLQNINLIKPFIDGIQNAHLKKTLQDWMFNNIEYDSVRLADLSINISLNKLVDTLLHKTKANIVIENPKVRLAKDVKQITAKQVTVVFSDANLTITPLNATFAGMDLSDSEIIIANMPHSDFLLDLHGKNVRYDSNIAKLLQHYNVTLPLTQSPLAQNTIKKKQVEKTTNQHAQMKEAISNTENLVTKALKTKQILDAQENENTNTKSTNKNIEQAGLTRSEEERAKNIINNEQIYAKILELNPKTTLTNELLSNPNIAKSGHNETASMHLQIAIKHNNKIPTKPLFSLRGIIQAQYTNLKLYDIPLKANKLNVALDITPNQKLVYISGDMVKWQRLIEADVNVLLDLNKQSIQANTYIHKAILNTGNLKDLKLVPNAPTTMQAQSQKFATNCKTMQCKATTQTTKMINKNIVQNEMLETRAKENYENQERYESHENKGIYIADSLPLSAKLRHFEDYSIIRTSTQSQDTSDAHKILEDAKKEQLKNVELSPEIIKTLPKTNIKDDGKMAKEDDKVLKDLKTNPVWNDLKIHSKKTQPFKKLSTQELTELAREEIERGKDSFMLPQDFLNIKNANIHINLSFANNKITLDAPALSLHLESSKNLQLKIAKIENILQFSPLARYYGITHGDFNLYTTQYPKTPDENVDRIDFTLKLTQLNHPLYTIKHKRVTDLSLKGHIQDGAIIVFVNDDIDFKSQDSLSMLRMRGYRIDIDEALHSKIPFFVDLFKDRQKDALPYSEAAISQELKFIAIKNKLRKQMKVMPIDFNIIGENLQFTFLGYTAPLDSVNIRFIDSRIIIDGQYSKGILNASLIKDNVYFRAKNFSGDFINIVLSSAKGGKKMLDRGTFSCDGVYKGGILNASLELQNTALIDFKSVQNIFALIDTVPSLFMFKDPHISSQGYQVNYGKVLFAVNSDYVGLQNIFLLGSSMDINGQGIIDIDTQEMNVNLSISTIKNLSKFINKIPIIGYLILGRDGQISTNLILSGKYVDPKVNITLAADIIKAPFNILRRVFPVEMLVNHANNKEDMMSY